MASDKLILQNFKVGMVDEEVLARMDYPDGSSSDALNVAYSPAGALAKRKGVEKLHTSAWKASAVSSIYQWTTTGGSDYTFVCSPVSGSLSAAIATMNTTGTEAVFSSILVTSGTWDPGIDEPISTTAYAGSAVFVFDSMAMGPVAWDGTVPTSAVTLAAAPSGAKVALGWGAYLLLGNVLVGGVRTGSRVYWCDPLIPTSWPAASYNDFDSDDGDYITGLVNFKNYIVVFKKYKMFIFSYVGGTLVFNQQRFSSSIGCVGPNAIYDDGDYLYWIGYYGFYRWGGVGEIEDIGDPIQPSIDNINFLKSPIFDVNADASSYQIWFNIAYGSSAIKNRIYTFDTRFKGWSRYDISASYVYDILYGANMTYATFPGAYSIYGMEIGDALGEKESLLTIGTYDGFVKKYGLTDSDDGVAIDAEWTSRWLFFGEPDKNKRIIRLTAFIEREGDYNLNVLVYKDWNDTTLVDTKTVSLSGSVDIKMVEKRIDFTMPCRAVQFKIGTSAVDSPFTLHKLIIEYKLKGRTLVS